MSTSILTGRMTARPTDSHTLAAYEQTGGYFALRRALIDMDSAAVAAEVKASNIRGRGGANFPTGVKWGFLPPTYPRYLVVNGDESEPGTFKDRQLLERDPHQLVEGVILAAYGLEVQQAFIYIRGEYAKPARRVERAIAEAYAAGYLGRDILGSGFDLEITLHLGAGAYICGEETALLNSLEGKRVSRASSLRFRRSKACMPSRRSSTMSKRSPTCRGSSARVDYVCRAWPGDFRRHPHVLGVGSRQQSGQLRSCDGYDLAGADLRPLWRYRERAGPQVLDTRGRIGAMVRSRAAPRYTGHHRRHCGSGIHAWLRRRRRDG